MRHALLAAAVLVATAAGCSDPIDPGTRPRDAASSDALFAAPDAAEDAAAPSPDVVAPDAPVVPPPPDAGPPAEPLTAPMEQWTWIEVSGMRCANGTTTGVGVNLTRRSDRVLIFLQGGGACWDGVTCWGPASTAFYVATGYNELAFRTDILRPALLPLRREDPNNPFRDMSLVYVPYCTGDVHAGDRVAMHSYLGINRPTHHVGARNLDALLPRIAATFPGVRRVWLAGDSAGGFGAAINYWRVARALPGARVDVLDDSGQPVQPDPSRWSAWRAAWNLQLPPDCPTCGDRVDAFVDYFRTRAPGSRFGLISYTYDSVISTFMGLTGPQFNTALVSLADRVDREWPNGRYYFLPGLLHVGLATPTPGLVTWLQQMISDDPAWASRRP